MKRIVYFLLLLTVMTIVFMSCRDEDVDMCSEEKLVSADFRMYREIYNTDSFFQVITDTFFAGGSIYFDALQDADSYEWKIGTDTRRFTDKTFYLNFGVTILGNITIRLIIKKTPNLDCFPEDDGIDTIYKSIHLTDIQESFIWGNWKGVSTNALQDSFTININSNRGIENFPNGCPGGIDFRQWYKNFILRAQIFDNSDCSSPTGSGYLSADTKEITINYEIYNEERTIRIPQQFKGIKIE